MQITILHKQGKRLRAVACEVGCSVITVRKYLATQDAPTFRSAAHGQRVACAPRCGAVVWTALPCKSRGCNGRMPSADEAVAYLRSLGDDERRRAEAYVRQTPRMIRTPFRACFEQLLGWTPIDPQDTD